MKGIGNNVERSDLIINQIVTLLTDTNGNVGVTPKENYILVNAAVLNDATMRNVEIFTAENTSLNPTVGYVLRAKDIDGAVYDRATRQYLLTWVRVN